VSSPGTLPADRYGAPPRGRRWALLSVVGVVVVAFLAWVGWAAWFHSTPEVTSELVGYTVLDEHSATARLDVRMDEGTQARCLLRAVSEDHTAVGELSFVPVVGRNEVVIRTEREATSVEKVGCTTDRQNQPR
jgi:hypothetical protein